MDDQDIILEDIIDDIAMDALELHDSDDYGADLYEEGLDLDDLEEDAIPDDPLDQIESNLNFDLLGQSPNNSPLNLSPEQKIKHGKALDELLLGSDPLKSSFLLRNQPKPDAYHH